MTGAPASYAPAVAQYTGPFNATTTIAGQEGQFTPRRARRDRARPPSGHLIATGTDDA